MDNIKRNELMKKLFAAMFFIGGILLIVFVVFTLGKEKGLTQPKFHVKTLFRNVGGLIEGAPVRLSGVNIGTVSDINFLDKAVDGRRVLVTLSIFDKYKDQLYSNSIFAIKTEGILGEKLIEITTVDYSSKLNIDQTMIGVDPIDVQDFAEVFAQAAESFTRTSDELSQIDVQELSAALSDTAYSLSITSKGINSILKELHYVAEKSKRLLNRIEEKIIDGTLFKFF